MDTRGSPRGLCSSLFSVAVVVAAGAVAVAVAVCRAVLFATEMRMTMGDQTRLLKYMLRLEVSFFFFCDGGRVRREMLGLQLGEPGKSESRLPS